MYKHTPAGSTSLFKGPTFILYIFMGRPVLGMQISAFVKSMDLVILFCGIRLHPYRVCIVKLLS